MDVVILVIAFKMLLDLELLKIIKLMLILGQVRLTRGWPCPAGLRKILG